MNEGQCTERKIEKIDKISLIKYFRRDYIQHILTNKSVFKSAVDNYL